MTDEQLRATMGREYAVAPLTQDAVDRIRTNAQRGPGAVRRRPVLTLFGALAPLTAAAVIGFPIVRSNMISFAIARQIRADRLYTVSASFGKDPAFVITRSGNDWSYRQREPQGYEIDFQRGNEFYQYFPSDRRVISRSVPGGQNLTFDLPDLIARSLSGPTKVAHNLGSFDIRRNIKRDVPTTVNGRKARQLTFDFQQGSLGEFVVTIADDTGEPLRMTSHLPLSPGANAVWDYDYDAVKAKRAIDEDWMEIQTEADAGRRFDVDLDRSKVEAACEHSPIARMNTGRDRLTVYRAETNSEGDVFVLYSLKGYHGDADHVGNWLRLADADGTEWLSSALDFEYSMFRLNGEYPKAQVFYHPRHSAPAGALKLFLKMFDWEFLLPQQRMWPPSSVRIVPVCEVRAARLAVNEPDWFFFNVGTHDPAWVRLEGMRLRFVNAIKSYDAQTAIAIGRQLEKAFPASKVGLFYTPCELFLGLYRAYRWTGDVVTARDYLRQAIANQDDTLMDYQVWHQIGAARKAEGL